MPLALTDHQYELGGVVFGSASPVFVQTFDPGSAEWDVQDASNPVGDGVSFGRDYLRPPLWTWDLGARGAGAAGAQAQLTELKHAWRTAGGRSEPGSLAVLRFALAGETFRVYGRPRRWAPLRKYAVDSGLMQAIGDFQLSDAQIYSDVAQSVDLDLIAESAGGLVLPTVLPAELGRVAGTREGAADVLGEAPCPFTVTITGPSSGAVSQITVAGPGWYLDLNAPIAYDQSVTIDTRTKTVLRNDGASLAGALTRRTRLDARLEPGLSSFSFTATDPTNTASASISWYPAREIL